VIDPLLSPQLAARFAATAIANIGQVWPQRVDGVEIDAHPLPPMQVHHPAFHGSYDWHSCVHMHWLLARLMHLFPQAAWHGEARRLLDARLTLANLQVELDYFAPAQNRLFERPYGWAWLFKLQSALGMLSASEPQALAWQQALSSLVDLLMTRFGEYLQNLSFPVRAGTHGNTAFAMLLALDLTRPQLNALIEERCRAWYLADRDYPAAYEPDGEDFLSGGLTEAALMSRVLDNTEFATWWDKFQPGSVGWLRWQQAVRAPSKTDGRLVHLTGLNLSRAWCLRLLAEKLGDADGRLLAIARDHLQASLPHVTGEDFAGDHWLASFATLALAPGD
jgi:hypothetical protein